MDTIKNLIIDDNTIGFLEKFRLHVKELETLADDHDIDEIGYLLSDYREQIEEDLLLGYAKSGDQKFYKLSTKYNCYNSGFVALEYEHYKIALHCFMKSGCLFEQKDLVKLLPYCEDDNQLKSILSRINDTNKDMINIIINDIKNTTLRERIMNLIPHYS